MASQKWKNMPPARRWQLDRIQADREYKKRLEERSEEKGNED